MKATILLVDDEPLLRRLLLDVLTREGFAVLAAATPHEALEISRGRSGIDLLITDVSMSGMSGFELAHAVLERQPFTKALLMSGYPQTLPETEPRMSFLQKPVMPSELIAVVRNLLG